MKATVYGLDGADADEVDLPSIFETPLRPDLVRRAVLAAQANRKQQHGSDPFAGLRTPAESFGSGRGMAHVPRQEGRGRRVPQTIKGRKAHPPKAEKDWTESINKKEKKLAVRSAIAATTDAELVAERGHEFDDDAEIPVVVSDEFEDLHKTQEVVEFLEAAGLADDIERADEGRSVRSGQGKARGRKYKTPTSILFVTSSAVVTSAPARLRAARDGPDDMDFENRS